jgi:glutamine amidotransferase
MRNVVIIDYGLGTIKSVQRAIEKVGATSVVTSNPELILRSDSLILPGVGSFENGMQGLRRKELIEPIKMYAQSGKPVLGICLGMQMLLESSEENGDHLGFGLIPGHVKIIPRKSEGVARKVPHIGWSALKLTGNEQKVGSSCLKNTVPGKFVYFVHSYRCVVEVADNLLAQCEYEGTNITAAIMRNNITGLQFHPEKSGEVGLNILKEFVSE